MPWDDVHCCAHSAAPARLGETAWYISPAPEQATSHRRPWFRCACCPPNVMRVLSSLEQYLATASEAGLQIQQYAACTIAATIDGGKVAVRVATDYPWDGTIEVGIVETPVAPWELSLRIPAWADGATVTAGGVTEATEPGYWRAKRSWAAGDRVRRVLPLTARVTAPMPRASAIYGCIAIERGPLVFCARKSICLQACRWPICGSRHHVRRAK